MDPDTYPVTDQHSRDTTFTYSVSGADRNVAFFDSDVLRFREGMNPTSRRTLERYSCPRGSPGGQSRICGGERPRRQREHQ